MTKEQLFDKELDIVHQCLAELYDFQYDNEKERIARIKKALSDIRELYDNNPVMQEGKEEKIYNAPHGLASRLPVDDEQPEVSPHIEDMQRLSKAIKDNPAGGSMVVRNGPPFYGSSVWSWANSEPQPECEHNYNYSCPKCK